MNTPSLKSAAAILTKICPTRGLCGLAAWLALAWVGAPVARAGVLPAGDYRFGVPLAPVYLEGTFSTTINGQPAVMTLHTDVSGVISGQMVFNGATYAVKGTFSSPDGQSVNVKLKATGDIDKYKFKAALVDAGLPTAALAGTARTGPAVGVLGTDTVPFTLDVSGAAPLVLGFDFSLRTVNALGAIKGVGSVTVNGLPISVVKAKSKPTADPGKTALTLKNPDLLLNWTGTGPTDANGALTADYAVTAFGATVQGAGLRVSQLETAAGGEVKDNTIAKLPPLSVNPPAPAGGSVVTVRFNVPGATSLTLTAAGEGSGNFTTYQHSGDLLVVTDMVGNYGQCVLTGVAVTAAGTQPFVTSFNVQAAKPILPRVKVEDSVFIQGNLPAKTGSDLDPDVASVSAPALINGGTARVKVNPSDVNKLGRIKYALVQTQGAGGATGYYQVPVTIRNSAATFDLRLDADSLPARGASAASRARTRTLARAASVQRAGTTQTAGLATPGRKTGRNAALPDPLADTGDQVQVTVKFIDVDGNVGQSAEAMLDTREVGTGNVQVSLSWDTPTDVDLHVVDPAGAEVYYGNPSVSSGGVLDLDSNPGCSIDGIDNENITWTDNAPYGEYIVRVDFYEACQGLGANYVVTVNVDGVTQTFQGSLSAANADRGGAGSGVEVARFNRTPGKFRVRGTASYEDFAPTPTGLSATSTLLPIRLAKAEVCRTADDAVLETGAVDQDGKFDLAFENTGTPGYYVRISAEQDDDTLKEKVVNTAGKVYFKKSDGTIDETATPDKTGLEIKAMRDDDTGPAFNIFDLGVKGNLTVLGLTGQNMPMLTWNWTKDVPGSCAPASCYHDADNSISVLSSSDDADEYDDVVLLHEYGHFFQNKFSKTNNPGGSHSSRAFSVPPLAWGEGSATFFGCYASGSPNYIDTNTGGIGRFYSIETLPADIPVGTSTGNQSGNVSEATVAAVLWDLADASNETGDTLTDSASVFKALFDLKTSTTDRGVTGIDLVDFLDVYFKAYPGSRGDNNGGIQGNVKLNGFPYDFTPTP